MGESRSIAIVDGNSLLHRAFHALPITLTGSDGRPTNAVYGFLTMLFSLVDKLEPFGVVVAFDCGKPAFRLDILEQYKEHRPPTAPELKDQFPMVKRVLETLAIPVIECEGWEGDDLLGTLSRKASEEGLESLLITGDKDAMQLVDEDVRVVSSGRGMGELRVYGPEEVEDRFGVRPEQIVDYLGLKGDQSDNIPGVPGIGEKTAAKLLAEYGSLDELLERAGEIKGKMGENLRAHAQDARDSRVVATIRRDVPVEVDFDDAVWGGWDAGAVLDAFRELRISSLAGRVVAGHEEEALAPGPVGELQPLVTGPEAPRAVAEFVAGLGEAAEAPWVGVAVDDGAGACLLPSEDVAVGLPDGNAVISDAAAAGEAVLALLGSARLAAPDVKAVLVAGGCEDERLAAADPERLFDCGIAAYLLESNRSGYDVRSLLAETDGVALDVGDDAMKRLAGDAQAARELAPPLLARLEDEGSLECFLTCEMPLVPVLARMEVLGIALDVTVLSALARETKGEIEALAREICEIAGTDFNIDSPKQLASVLFEKLGLPPGKRKKTGFSTDSSVLAPLAEDWPIAGRILAYRELTKLTSTYLDALPGLVGEDGRIHTTFNQTVAATGRLSSSNPNLQNIPVRTELGRRIRAAFVPGDGFDALLTADYSQIELRILAHLSGEESLIEAFTSGADFHAATAGRVFGRDPGDVDAELRRRAKAVNFGIVYGISAHGLAQQLGIGRAEAQEMIDRYFRAYPKVREFLDRAVEEARERGYAMTMTGRRRPIPEFRAGNRAVRAFAERTAMNHPMQGAAADLMKLAMIEVDRRIREEGLASRMVLQVHDELVFEAVRDEIDALSALVTGAMCDVADLSVPLEVDVSHGPDWASAK